MIASTGLPIQDIELGFHSIDLKSRTFQSASSTQEILGCICALSNMCDTEYPNISDLNKCKKYDIINFSSGTLDNEMLTNISEIQIDKSTQNYEYNEKTLQKIKSIINASHSTREVFKTILVEIKNIVEDKNLQKMIKDELLEDSKKYKTTLETYNTNFKKKQDAQVNLATNLKAQQGISKALLKKIQLAMTVLNVNGNRLQQMTKNLATYRAQNAQHDQDRVAIGLPYLSPFFTMSNRNYVIMMLVFIVVLVIVIFVYAFAGRTSS